MFFRFVVVYALYYIYFIFSQTGITLNDQATAIRDTGVSWHHGGPSKGPFEHHGSMVMSGVRGTLIMSL